MIIRNGKVLWRVKKIIHLFHLHLSLVTHVWNGGMPDFINIEMAVKSGNHMTIIE
jgi:hypothetical protein